MLRLLLLLLLLLFLLLLSLETLPLIENRFKRVRMISGRFAPMCFVIAGGVSYKGEVLLNSAMLQAA